MREALSPPALAMMECLRLLIDRSHVVGRHRGTVVVEFGASAFDRFIRAVDIAAGDPDLEDAEPDLEDGHDVESECWLNPA